MGLVKLTWEGDATMPLSRKPCYILYVSGCLFRIDQTCASETYIPTPLQHAIN